MKQKKRVELVNFISQLVSTLSEKEKQEILTTVMQTKKDSVPVSIFRSKLSGLEVIVLYLKEVQHKTVKEISQLINRKPSTIYTTLSKAKKKKTTKHLGTSDISIEIPLQIFDNRKFSILESLIFYLREEHNLSLKEISTLLNKNYNTVKTVYYRYHKKCQKKK